MKTRADMWSGLSCPHCEKPFSLGVRIPLGNNLNNPALLKMDQDDEIVEEWVHKGSEHDSFKSFDHRVIN